MKKKIVFFTGSGISKAAGIPTFRESKDGLWENYDPREVAYEGCFERDPEKAYGFYTYLHGKYRDLQPTEAHRMIAALEKREDWEVTIITQNVDDLHEKAGSSRVLHLHGELSKIQAVDNPRWVKPWGEDVIMHEDTVMEGHYIRPHIVLFGEEINNFQEAVEEVKESDALVVIGTSLVVFPAADLIKYAKKGEVFYIDPCPTVYPTMKRIFKRIIRGTAEEGLERWLEDYGKENEIL